MIALLLAASLFQSSNICDTDAQGPFVVTTGRTSYAQWCTAATVVDPVTGQFISARINGFYVSLDGAARQDVGMATSLGFSTVTQRNAWQQPVPAVQKGSHTYTVIAWSYVLDSNGNPTTARQESAATSVPFTAVDPVSNALPPAAQGLRVVR